MLAAGAILFRYFPRHAERRPVAPQPVAVVAARAHLGSIGIYVNGLGTVVPVNTVTVTSRVDGQLMEVLYREGQLVREGDLLAVVDSRPYQVLLTQFEGALARDQALLENARTDLARYGALLPQHAIPEQTYVTQQSLVRQYEGNVKTDQGQIESARLNIAYCRIAAPVTGRVGLRLVDAGNLVTANTTSLLVITQVAPTTVVFTIGEDQLPGVRRKLAAGARLSVDAYDRLMQTRLASGRLLTIDNQIDPTTGTVRLRAIFANTGETLFANQFVNARLLLEERRKVVLVPNAAIQRNGASTYVWMVRPNRTVTNRPVTVGGAGPAESQIVSGIAPGDMVVTEGVDRLHEGAQVNAAPSAGGA